MAAHTKQAVTVFRPLVDPNNRKTEHLIRLPKPAEGWVKCNCDGAVKNSNSISGAAGVIRDCSGNWIGGISRNIGLCAITKAEFWAIYDTLQLAWNMGFRRVQLLSDSQCALSLIQQEMVRPGRLAPLIHDIKGLLRREWIVEISHVFPEGNRSADFLDSHALNLSLGLHILDEPPPGLSCILTDDLHLQGLGLIRICNS